MAAASASRATPSTSYKFTMQQPSTSHAQLRTGHIRRWGYRGATKGTNHVLVCGERGPRCRSCGRDLKIAVIATPRKKRERGDPFRLHKTIPGLATGESCLATTPL